MSWKLLDAGALTEMENDVRGHRAQIGDVLRVPLDILNAGDVVVARAREVDVETDDTIVPSRRKGFHEMRADEAGAAGDEDGLVCEHMSRSGK